MSSRTCRGFAIALFGAALLVVQSVGADEKTKAEPKSAAAGSVKTLTQLLDESGLNYETVTPKSGKPYHTLRFQGGNVVRVKEYESQDKFKDGSQIQFAFLSCEMQQFNEPQTYPPAVIEAIREINDRSIFGSVVYGAYGVAYKVGFVYRGLDPESLRENIMFVEADARIHGKRIDKLLKAAAAEKEPEKTNNGKKP